MGEVKDEFRKGQEMAHFQSHSGAIFRACFFGVLIATVIWGPFWAWWGRLILCVIVAMVVGMFATRERKV